MPHLEIGGLSVFGYPATKSLFYVVLVEKSCGESQFTRVGRGFDVLTWEVKRLQLISQ